MRHAAGEQSHDRPDRDARQDEHGRDERGLGLSARAPVIIVGRSRVLVEPTDEDLTNAISSVR